MALLSNINTSDTLVQKFNNRFDFSDSNIINAEFTPNNHYTYKIYDRENLKQVVIKKYTFSSKEDQEIALNHLEHMDSIYTDAIIKNSEIIPLQTINFSVPTYFLFIIQDPQPANLHDLINQYKFEQQQEKQNQNQEEQNSEQTQQVDTPQNSKKKAKQIDSEEERRKLLTSQIGVMNLQDLISFAKRFIGAFQTFRENNIFHLNIKSRNFLRNSKGEYKISDFLITKNTEIQALPNFYYSIKSVNEYLNYLQERNDYLDGENVKEYRDQMLNRIDMFSFGLVLLQLILGLSDTELYELEDMNGVDIEVQKIKIPQLKRLLQILLKSLDKHVDLNQCLQLCNELTLGENYDDYEVSLIKGTNASAKNTPKVASSNSLTVQANKNNRTNSQFHKAVIPDDEEYSPRNNDQLDLSAIQPQQQDQQMNTQEKEDLEQEEEEVRDQIYDLTQKNDLISIQENQQVTQRPKEFKRNTLIVKGFKQLYDYAHTEENIAKYGKLKIYINESLNSDEEIISLIPKIIDKVGIYSLNYLLLGLSYKDMKNINILINYLSKVKYLQKLELMIRGNKIKSGLMIAESISKLQDLSELVLYMSQNQIQKGGEIIQELNKLQNLTQLTLCLSENKMSDGEEIVQQIEKIAPQLNRFDLYIRYNPFTEEQIELFKQTFKKYGNFKLSGLSVAYTTIQSPEQEVQSKSPKKINKEPQVPLNIKLPK